MSVEVSSMPQYPPLPRFATASSFKSQQQQQLSSSTTTEEALPTTSLDNSTTNNYFNGTATATPTATTTTVVGTTAVSSACDQDFDLLAEYLLDDNTLNSNVVGFTSSGYYDVSSELNSFPSTITGLDIGNGQHQQQLQLQLETTPNPMAVSFSDPIADANSLYQHSTVISDQQQQQVGQIAPLPTQPNVPILTAPAKQQQPQPIPQQYHVPQAAPVVTSTMPQNNNYYANTNTSTNAPIQNGQQLQQSTTIVHHHHQQTMQQQAAQTQTTSLSGYKRPSPTATINQQHQPPLKTNQRHKSQAQLDKRRERNRILARQTRLRKKYFFESLQKEVMDLQYENIALKEIVKQNFPCDKIKHKILEECKLTESLLSQTNQQLSQNNAANQKDNDNLDSDNGDNDQSQNNLEDVDYHFICSVKKSQQCFVITDPSLYDNPIVYASDDFYSLTGYSRDEVLGRNCRFLQGKDTSKDKIHNMKTGIGRGEDVGVCMINYTAQGIAFWNQLFIAALRDTQGNVVNFIGVLVKVQSPPTDDPEYGKPLINDANIDANINKKQKEPISNNSNAQKDNNNVDELLGAASAAVSAAEAATTTDNVLAPTTTIPLVTASTSTPASSTTANSTNNNSKAAPATAIA